ncbi:MAG: hypothetical protein E3J21_10680 [Anaerolineales bacterium]|nr:MAG: hypothetical protein E3J21_10680 [Anaerolineales bacterium]
MGLDIWFAEDIRNALLAANEASAATAAVMAEVGGGPSTPRQARDDAGSGPGPSTVGQTQGSGQAVTDSTELLAVSLRAYREGYKAALTTVALAFGIAPQTITLRQAQDEILRPFDCAQGRPLRQAQDRPLRQAQDRALDELGTTHVRDAIPQRGGEPQVTYLAPRTGGS